MAPTAGIPILLYGRGRDLTAAIAEKLAPEYDTVHCCNELKEALPEIPAVLRGERIVPSTGIGSNVGRAKEDRRMPKAVVVGGGIPADDLEKVKAAVETKDVLWIKVTPDEVKAAGGVSVETLAPLARRKLKEAGL